MFQKLVTKKQKFFFKLRTNTKLTQTQNNYLKTSIYMPLAELRPKRKWTLKLMHQSPMPNCRVTRKF